MTTETPPVPAAPAPAPSSPAPATNEIPISRANLRECLDSARYWIQFLPAYASAMQRRADLFAISAGVLAAITGLTAWAGFAKSSDPVAQGAVLAVSLLSAFCALLPRVKNYAEMAGHARELTARYGQASGDLLDLWYDQAALGDRRAHEIIKTFDAIKAAKDANLRELPLRPAGEVRRDQDGVALWPLDVYRIAKKGQPLPKE